MTQRKPKELEKLIPWLVQNKPEQVNAMVERINSALKDRAFFERAKAPNSSHVELRRIVAQFMHNKTVAAFFIVCGADPALIFNRERKAGTRANLKGLKKVKQLIDYVTGKTNAFETVSKALFAATIIAALKGCKWIASPEQELILSDESVSSLPEEISTAIYSYQHKHMTIEGDSRPQSCQFRTTFNNLGMYSYSREEFDSCDYTLGINVNLGHPVIEYLATRWNLHSFKGNANV